MGFCRGCEALYRAGRRLRERLLVEQGARIAAAHPELFSALSSADRRVLLAHLAAHARAGGAGSTAITPAGLEDVFRELVRWPAGAGGESGS